MRLDKYLKVSRLIKRRTVANEVADAGRILINGKIAKASQAVKAGDIIEVTFGNRPIKVKVLDVYKRQTAACITLTLWATRRSAGCSVSVQARSSLQRCPV